MCEYIIWGTGLWGRKVYTALEANGKKIRAFCDSNSEKWNTHIGEYAILSKDDFFSVINSTDSIKVVVAIKNEKQRNEIIELIRSRTQSDILFESINDVFNNYFIRQLSVNHSKLVDSWNVDICECIDEWCENIYSEVESWVNTAINLDHPLHYKYDSYRENECFHLMGEKDLPINIGSGSIVMDIGCGLFSKYGEMLPSGERITLIPVDALAHFWNYINSLKINCPRSDYVCQFGLFEFMSNSWQANYADLIIIGNALDHCIDPYRSTIECFNVLKIGGVLRLIHARAEGLWENWEGLHKWNIDYHDKDVIIWNKDYSVNLTKHLGSVADIQMHCYKGTEDGVEREYITVDIIKKTDIELSKWVDTSRDGELTMKIMSNIMNEWANDSNQLKENISKIRIN